MALVPGICTQCGATLSADNVKDCMICPYCNTPFIVEKAIQYFNNTYNYYISNSEVHIHGGKNEESFEQMCERAYKQEAVGSFDDAMILWEKLVEKFPDRVESWIGIMGYIFKSKHKLNTIFNAILQLDKSKQQIAIERVFFNIDYFHSTYSPSQWKTLIKIVPLTEVQEREAAKKIFLNKDRFANNVSWESWKLYLELFSDELSAGHKSAITSLNRIEFIPVAHIISKISGKYASPFRLATISEYFTVQKNIETCKAEKENSDRLFLYADDKLPCILFDRFLTYSDGQTHIISIPLCSFDHALNDAIESETEWINNINLLVSNRKKHKKCPDCGVKLDILRKCPNCLTKWTSEELK